MGMVVFEHDWRYLQQRCLRAMPAVSCNLCTRLSVMLQLYKPLTKVSAACTDGKRAHIKVAHFLRAQDYCSILHADAAQR